MNIIEAISNPKWVDTYVHETFPNRPSYNIHNDTAAIFKDSKLPLIFNETKKSFTINKTGEGIVFEDAPGFVRSSPENLGKYLLIRRTGNEKTMVSVCRNISMAKYGPDNIMEEACAIEIRIGIQMVYGELIFDIDELQEAISRVYNKIDRINSTAVPCLINNENIGFVFFGKSNVGFAGYTIPFKRKDGLSFNGYITSSKPIVQIMKNNTVLKTDSYDFHFGSEISNNELHEAYAECFIEAFKTQYENYMALVSLKSLKNNEFLYCTKSITPTSTDTIWNAVWLDKNENPRTRTLYEGDLVTPEAVADIFGFFMFSSFIQSPDDFEDCVRSGIIQYDPESESAIKMIYPTEDTMEEVYSQYDDTSEIGNICTEHLTTLFEEANELELNPGIPEKIKECLKNF